MPIDLAELIDPSHTAVVLQECQQGVIGSPSALPPLAEAVAASGMIDRLAALARAAREAGAAVIHGVAHRRPDGRGANSNARLFQHMPKAPVLLTVGTPAVEVLPEIGVAESDFVIPRLHGLSPFQGGEMDSILRNLGVSTIVGVGVSVNVAIMNLTFDAVNAAYQVVIPRDAVAGWPDDYVEAVFRNTLGGVATLCTTDDVLQAWKAA